MTKPLSDADVHRSTPGYVYGTAIHSSRQEEGTPSCSCPCHLASGPRGATSWYCDGCSALLVSGSISFPEEVPAPAPVKYSHEQAIADGKTNPRPYMVSVPDYYFLTRGNSLDDAFPRRHFKSGEAAEKAARKLNDADVITSLNVPPTHQQRFDRFRALRGDHHHWYDEGHSLAGLPSRPGRYAVEDSYEGDTSWMTYDTMAEVEKSVLSGNVSRIVDLDTGDDIPFALSAHFGQEVATMRER